MSNALLLWTLILIAAPTTVFVMAIQNEFNKEKEKCNELGGVFVEINPGYICFSPDAIRSKSQ
jgi:hypothetical protein